MNKARRKKLESIAEQIRKLLGDIESLKEEVECVRDDEQEVLDNLKERFSETERYQIVSDNVDSLDSIVSDFEEGIDNLDRIADDIDDVVNNY